MIKQALHAVLAGDWEVTSRVSTYTFGTGEAAKPTIFNLPSVPEDAELPAICIDGPVGGNRWGTRDSIGAESLMDVSVWGDKTRSSLALEELAWKVWEALERTELSVSGYEEVGCLAQPPRALQDPNGFPGYVIQVLVRTLKT